ncbi:MAG: 16S rRNA (adenine(1518)-N(6)/adenine(1519)-N(6))-dimethyltransferase RsmA [Verrucomicrobium sp.]|nr:16S rRNA (adenine(1518)-N(6)/adenine(1519)-N(6))-dimethyltransferase RsmA [Verrucomicrobium sp.]
MASSFAPKKSLGQNFLHDTEVARWIAEEIRPDGAPLLIEIGPGQAAMTTHLVGRAQKLLLLEKDNTLAADLKTRFAESPDVEVWHGDATRFDLRPLYRYGPIKVIGNLPYSMGGEILRHVLTPPTPVGEAVFMLQKEVCQRLAARQEDDAYGGLSLVVQHDWEVEILRIISPEVFKPRPKVDSAIVRFTPRPHGDLPVHDRALFDRLVRMGFSQRRKQLKNLLPETPGGWDSLMSNLSKPPTIRAEELTLWEWVALTRHYEGRHEEDRGQKASEIFDVVNEQNEVIGQAPRGEVHAKGLRHRAVHIFVFNKHGDLWLQQRSYLKDVHPLTWDSSAAGHLDAGEDYATCAVRELHEEIGITAPTTCIAKVPACEATGWEFVELHRAEHNGPMKFAPDEIINGNFFKVTDIQSWIEARPQDFATGFIECFRLWRGQQEQ